jgi:methenyltetrahydromethanopterin cyclohydrolase
MNDYSDISSIKRLLLVAQSGRMLAAMAREIGLDVVVIDCYADCDTRQMALATYRVQRLDGAAFQDAVQQACVEFQPSHAVFASGFESCLQSLHWLASRLPLLGTGPEALQRLQDKAQWFDYLRSRAIVFPPSRFAPPHEQGWLQKPLRGYGGLGIVEWQGGASADNGVYWQRRIDGQVYSALGLGYGGGAQLLGFNRQWHRPQDFVFSAIANRADLPQPIMAQLRDWAQSLVRQYALRGLFSLDFILDDNGRAWLLEVNARIPASAQLYPQLLRWHLQACLGLRPDEYAWVVPAKVYAVHWANRSFSVPSAVDWPDYALDRPQAGQQIATGQPICSIISGFDEADVLPDVLQPQHQFIDTLLFNSMQFQASVNKLSQPLVQQLLDRADALRLGVERLSNGATVIDAGIKVPGGLEAGRIITEICMGGLGSASLTQTPYTEHWPLSIHVHSSNPVLACLGSQYAGWSLSHEKYYALGSGPARAMATKSKDGAVEPVEELYKELEYRDSNDATVLVIENDALPPVQIVDKVAAACGVPAGRLTIIVTPTSSLAGGVQVVGRVLEVAMHKAHALHFPLENIVDGHGSAPICPPHPNFVKAMGRTNDAILFAGQVHLFVKGSDEAAENLAKQLPSSTSKDYGKPFAEVFKAYEYDFFKIDAMLFSPASVIVTAVESGKSFRAGALDNALLDQSFGYGK